MNVDTLAAENFFSTNEKNFKVEKYGQGIIHDTYLVTFNNGASRFILQRINTEVFQNPATIMHNLRLVSEHINERMQTGDSGLDTNWQVLYGINTRDGRDYFIDADGDFWRALSFISEATPLEQISSLDDAREVGRALGIFHWLMSDLNPELLHETLPGFHNIEHYLKQYDVASGKDRKISELEQYCRQFVDARRKWAPVLENGRRNNELKIRVIHGDPKINNIMVDRKTGKAVSIIDLDTVMPGLVQYDIGDCLRSCCNTMGEETDDFSMVRFDLKRCEAVLSGYICEARRFLTGKDFDFLFDSTRLIPFELGLRFFTDFLNGNVYFKVSHSRHNLNRAIVQFRLVESIELQEKMIRTLIEKCRSDS
jgi:Ser/Thr protein kinase RdoA (MazF antagonist)